MKKLYIIALFLFSLFLNSCVHKNDTKNLTMTKESDHFILKYSEDNDMGEIITELEKTYNYFLETYNIVLDKKTTVYIYPSITDYHNGIGMPNSENWSVGSADDQGLYMVSPYNPGGVHDYDGIIEVASHEYIHYITMQIIDYNIYLLPSWISEGFAMYESGQYQSMKEEVEIGIMAYGIPSFEKLTGYEDFVKNDGYHYSPAIVHFLVENYGGRQRIIELIKNKGDVTEVYGKTEKELESECVTYYQS